MNAVWSSGAYMKMPSPVSQAAFSEKDLAEDARCKRQVLFPKKRQIFFQDIRYSGKNGESPVTEEGKRLRMMIERQMAESGMLQMSFNQMTVELMKQKKMTIRKLADETGLSEETIKNMRNDPARVFQIREIVAVCIAMHLSQESSDIYIKAGPSKFLSGTDMMLYQYALHQWYTLPVDMVNRRLVEAGAKPLTNLVEGYDENGVKMA